MEVAAFLRDLGLERYIEAFRDNDVDADVLPKLTAEDLIALGISSVGHRRKLLEAIAVLSARPCGPREAEPSPTNRVPELPLTRREAERRQLTVMFVDLVGSTALSARLDPEDMRDVIAGYQSACGEVIGRYEGHVAKYMGDGVLAYFGYPRAHEDDAERAVRAGLEVADVIARQRVDGQALVVRVGIATGQVVVGDLIGEGAAQEEAVVGETPNLAARLQDLAEAGTVVIAPSTRQLMGGLFDLADLGARALRGFTQPVRAWRVKRERSAESRFEARNAAGLAPLVGRTHELALLLDRWARAKDGEGQVVLLSGEPGIGKSRIVRGLMEALTAEPHARLRYQCSPHHTNSAFHPIVEQLARAAGFQAHDPAEARLDKLEALVGPSSADLTESAALLATVLGIPTCERYPPLDLAPERQKQRTLETLIEYVEALAVHQTVLMVCEDAHWIDPSTQEAFDHLVARVDRLAVLLVLTFRPEYVSPWVGRAHLTQLSLNRLSRREGAAIVARLAGGKALPNEVQDQILAKTDGVPLFVEELTKTVLESGLLRDAGDHYDLTGPLSSLAIPATLHDSLMARLDRLAPVREVAQIAAVIGREFAHDLLAALVSEDQLNAALDQLLAAELIFRRGTPPAATYTFKHALVQDTAYQSLLKAKRQALHACVARVLRERFPETTIHQPEVLAHHLTKAALTEQAIDSWNQAGEVAMTRSANLEAIAHFTKGLELLKTLPESPARDETEYRLQVAIGAPLVTTRGYAAREVEAAYSRALDLSRRIGKEDEVFPALRGLWNWYLTHAELSRASELADELLAAAESQSHGGHRVAAHRATGTTLFFMGRPAAAKQQFERGLALYQPAEHRAYTALYGENPGVVCQLYIAWIDDFLGKRDQALRRLNEAVALAWGLAHPYSLAFALSQTMILRLSRGEVVQTLEAAESGIQLCSEHRFAQWLGEARFHRGWALAAQGKQPEGIALMRQGLAALRATGCQTVVPFYLGELARVCADVGRSDEGLAALMEALVDVDRTEERVWEAELHRLRGEFWLKSPDSDPTSAEVCFRKAIAIAEGQSAKVWELRAATSLARLWGDRDRHAQAHNLLAPIYDRFTEGFDTADLEDAKALLDELR